MRRRKPAPDCASLFLRGPIDRMISLYFHLKGLSAPRPSGHSYFLDNDLSVERFAHLPIIGKYNSSVFFGGIDMASFDLIGFYHQVERDFATLQRELAPAPVPKEKHQ